MKKIFKHKHTLGVIFALTLAYNPVANAYTQEFADYVANRYLSTFPTIATEKKPEMIIPKSYKDFVKFMWTPRYLGLRDLHERDMREITFKQMQKAPTIDTPVIDRQFIDKMQIVRGEAQAMDHLAARITMIPEAHNFLHTFLHTQVGTKRLIEMLSQPMLSLAGLRSRQTIIKTLVSNDLLRNQCTKLLEKIKASESLVFDLYTRNDESESEKLKFVQSAIPGVRGAGLSITTRLMDLFILAYLAVPPILTYQAIQHARTTTEQNKAVEKGVMALMFGIDYPIFISLLKLLTNIRLNMQERLMGMATYIASLQQLVKIVQENSAIAPLLPELQTVSQQLAYDARASKEFNQLNKLLRTSTFAEGKPSALSSPGNIVGAYEKIIKESVRKEYAAAMNLLGELDVYVALANKIKAHEHENAQFCLVDFIETTDHPVIQASNFWNPFIDYKKVVTNDVALNTGGERNIILTGPNTGGKSTIMKGLMFCTLLAQTFGIAPAQSCAITPFAKLLTYLNIADDTATGVSLFKAEINRAKEIFDTIRSLKPSEFAFVIVDELFTGTSPDKAEELSLNFIKQLSEFKNCIFIVATHVKKLTELEKETNGVCKNYYTGVVVQDEKVVKYTYKLVPGVSPISSAKQIAQEEGVVQF